MKYLVALALFLGLSAQVMAYDFTIENCKNGVAQSVLFSYQAGAGTQNGKIFRDTVSAVSYNKGTMVKLDGGLKALDPIYGQLFIYCDDSAQGCRLEHWSDMKWPCPKSPAPTL